MKSTHLVFHKMTKPTIGKLMNESFYLVYAFLETNLVKRILLLNRALQDSADRLKSSFEALRPEGGFLSTQKARDVLVKTGLSKDQLREIWNLSDMDRDGLFDHEEYVVAMFLCDAVIQKGRPIPSELPISVIPPSKRSIVGK
jgi:hypothetical protein